MRNEKCSWFYRKVRVRLLIAWYDMWMGAYWDRRSRKLYILPVPCLGIIIEWQPGPK